MTLPGVKPFSTVYVGPRLIISSLFDVGPLFGRLGEVAAELGWTVTPDAGPTCPTAAAATAAAPAPLAGRLTHRRRRGQHHRDGGQRRRPCRPRTAGCCCSRRGRSFGVEAMRGRRARPRRLHPRRHVVDPTRACGRPTRACGRPTPADMPIVVLHVPRQRGPAAGRLRRAAAAPPARQRDRRPPPGRWPILDTGCGRHPWLDGVVQTRRRRSTASRSATSTTGPNPEIYPDQVGPLDGGIDPLLRARHLHLRADPPGLPGRRHHRLAGGRLRRPDPGVGAGQGARRTSWPWSSSTPPTREQGGPIDILSLSMGYYHETPEDELFDPTVWEIMRAASARPARTVVCSAGNDATARPMFPAAFGPWARRQGPDQARPGIDPDRVGGRAQPQRLHGRAVLQRRPVGAGPRLRRRRW